MMNLSNLDNLVKAGHLKIEATNQAEIIGLVNSGKTRLKDANNTALENESRFDLAYNAAHSLALAALRHKGYRSNNRYIIFQVLPITMGLGPEVWRVLAKCHDQRNKAGYEGFLEMDEQLLKALLNATQLLLKEVKNLIE